MSIKKIPPKAKKLKIRAPKSTGPAVATLAIEVRAESWFHNAIVNAIRAATHDVPPAPPHVLCFDGAALEVTHHRTGSDVFWATGRADDEGVRSRAEASATAAIAAVVKDDPPRVIIHVAAPEHLSEATTRALVRAEALLPGVPVRVLLQPPQRPASAVVGGSGGCVGIWGLGAWRRAGWDALDVPDVAAAIRAALAPPPLVLALALPEPAAPRPRPRLRLLDFTRCEPLPDEDEDEADEEKPGASARLQAIQRGVAALLELEPEGEEPEPALLVLVPDLAADPELEPDEAEAVALAAWAEVEEWIDGMGRLGAK
ncbi:MAG: hypothetical protein Q8P18_05720 [Pseudomonadota bacterium]|nr:hypothetical protein [Pseudomonadota bacterium]